MTDHPTSYSPRPLLCAVIHSGLLVISGRLSFQVALAIATRLVCLQGDVDLVGETL
jgi:hypothetical protein